MRSQRIRYLISYDIRNEKRLRRVHKIVRDFGSPLQYSVYVGDLDHIELLLLKEALHDVIHHNEDSVVIINLGPPDGRGETCFDFLGPPVALPVGGPTIV